MSVPDFYVVARVVGRPGAIEPWKERLVPLCEVSATEPLGHTYYWGQDLDGEPDTLWGLEGYSHAVGFFKGHPASDIFKREMALVDQDQLLKHEQGLASRDYDLYHYDDAGGWYTKEDDPEKHSKTSHVVVHHFFAQAGKRENVIRLLGGLAEISKTVIGVQSCGVLRECNDKSLVTLWVRYSQLLITYPSCMMNL
ncbi:hypothetical protein LSUB1_G002991 [Lachnellula subtilissima]|uniref:ABM domain-containing protein n=1 Tax=Lachnellula subtilissima TaxID=602034 RepID=A0A8H8RUD4_9HELO|nr:hypothetical protein LSUB1_G002991 [Lachnellula subtilissima]